jgi:hypothetical protein
MSETIFNSAVKSAASTIVAIIALLAHAFDWSPVFVSEYLLDLVTSLICSIGAVYWAVKHRGETV